MWEEIKCPIYWTLYFFVPIVTVRDNGGLLFVAAPCKIYAAAGGVILQFGDCKKALFWPWYQGFQGLSAVRSAAKTIDRS